MASQTASPALSFHVRSLSLASSGSGSNGNLLGPRLGRLSLLRSGSGSIDIPTPNLWAHTSRGVVPHMTRDNVARSSAITGVHIPFES